MVRQITTFNFPITAWILFSSFFGTFPKIGSFRLPTHTRDAHRNFFDDPYFFLNEILTMQEQMVP